MAASQAAPPTKQASAAAMEQWKEFTPYYAPAATAAEWIAAVEPTPAAVFIPHYAPAAAAVEWKHDFVLQVGEDARKSVFIVDADAVGTGMAFETAKSCVKVQPAEDGLMAVKVESSYMLLPRKKIPDGKEKAKLE